MNQYVGIDVSKAQLDVAIGLGEEQSFPNTEAGWNHLVEALRPLELEAIVLEATGGYEKGVLRKLLTEDLPAIRVNPRQVRAFAKASGILAKTDKLDAKILVKYAQVLNPEIHRVSKNEKLQALIKRRRQFLEIQTQEKNRSKQLQEPFIEKDIVETLLWLKSKLQALEEQIETVLDNLPLADCIRSIQGMGRIATATLIADLPEIGTLNSKQIAALAGLAPYNCDSGSYRGKRKIYGGRSTVRTSLYMSAMSAKRHDPVIKAFYEKLRSAGKPFKVAITACMRKLLVIVNAKARDSLKLT